MNTVEQKCLRRFIQNKKAHDRRCIVQCNHLMSQLLQILGTVPVSKQKHVSSVSKFRPYVVALPE